MDCKLYHEKQEAALCGVHCLNTLLQGPYISEWDLAKIAHEFDALEANLMGQQGLDTPDFLKFAAEGSGNVARDGMFSIQVLQKALSNWDLRTTPMTHPNMQVFSMDPTRAAGYICNHQEHWFTIRPIQGQWWNFNSLLPAPLMLGLVHLHIYLETLRNDNWTIYVVQGTLPIQADLSVTHTNSGARLWTPEEAKLAHESSTVAKKRAKGMGIMEDLLQSAKAAGGLLSVAGGHMGSSTGPPPRVNGLTEDEQLTIAMRESLAQRAGPSGAAQSQQAALRHTAQGSHEMDEDPELAHAIAASLASLQGSADSKAASDGPRSVPRGATDMQSKLGLLSHPLVEEKRAAQGGTEATARSAGQETGKSGDPDDMAMVELVVKLPDNKRVQAEFRRADSVGCVISWLDGQGLNMKTHRLFRSHPRLVLDGSVRLQDVGIQAREMLNVERIP